MDLQVFQSFWAMGGLPYGGTREWSIAEKLDMVLEGGFNGVEIAWIPTSPTAEAVERAQTAGLPFGLVCIPASVAQFRASMETIQKLDPKPVYIDIQPGMKSFSVSEGVASLRELVQISADGGFRTLVETHRDRMTTDLRFTLELMDAFPEMRMNADLSHYVVGQEFALPLGDENDKLIRRVIERADMYHGRVASNEQVQISSSWDYHRPWLDLFLGWWQEGFRLWRGRSNPGDELVFVTEIGPPPYAITGPEGREMSDRWDESLMMKRLIQDIWEQLKIETGVL